jgi:hypothetical protein
MNSENPIPSVETYAPFIKVKDFMSSPENDGKLLVKKKTSFGEVHISPYAYDTFEIAVFPENKEFFVVRISKNGIEQDQSSNDDTSVGSKPSLAIEDIVVEL